MPRPKTDLVAFIGFNLTVEMKDRLFDYAAREHRTVSQYLRHIIDNATAAERER